MNAQFKPHPDGVKAYMGHDRLTGLYSVRIGWTVYAANANGSVLYTEKGEVKTPLNVEEFKAKRPKVYTALMNEISFQRKKALATSLHMTAKLTRRSAALLVQNKDNKNGSTYYYC